MNTAVKTAPASAWGKISMPSFFDPKNAKRFDYHPGMRGVLTEALDYRGRVSPAASDEKKVHLLLIDVQKDFCFPEGTLYVGGRSGTGAMDDSLRMAEFIYRNLDKITKISPTLDTHLPYQIFSPSFWEKADGAPVDPMTIISAEQIRKGEFKPSAAAAKIAAGGDYIWLMRQVEHYCDELEKAGKYQLCIWPEHCLLGTDGHTLVGVIQEAAAFQAYVRGAQTDFQIKGGNPLTENYSVLRPEVLTRWDGKPLPGGQKNTNFIKALLDADYVIIAGQAASHCVKSSIDDLLSEIVAQDPALARKVYVMEDCMSAVAVPNPKGGFYADFTKDAEDALNRFKNAGMHVVRSTDPMDRWPDFQL